MERIRIVARADDLGSSRSANMAIDKVTRAGFIRNVSIMAPAQHVEHAAGLLAGRRDICFGMHTTLNAEWAGVKWGPVSPLGRSSGLVDENGYFLANPATFRETKPAVEVIMKEVDAQLERLHSCGFNIKYVDSHMFPEMFIDGYDEAMAEFIRRKGLVDHMYYYVIPPGFKQLASDLSKLPQYLKSLPDGQYFFLSHPSLDTEEMRQAGNASTTGAAVAKSRAKETEMLSNKALRTGMKLFSCGSVRYDEAKPLPVRLTVRDITALLSQI